MYWKHIINILNITAASIRAIDSSSDNALSEMKQVADTRSDGVSKVFSHLEEKQELDPATKITNDRVKKPTLKLA